DSKNITLHDGGRRKRGGTTPVGTAITGTPQILGLYDFEQTDGTQFQMIAAGGGVYKNYSDTIKTGLSTSNYYSFAKFDDVLYFTDGDSELQTWDGAAGSSSNVSQPATDWGAGNYPQQLVNHGRKLSQRLWTWCGNNVIYGSKIGDASKFGVDGIFYKLYRGNITAIWEFADRLFIFTKNKTFLLDDSDADNTNWGFEQTPFFAGASHWRVIAETDNDLYIMMDDGEIYSMRSVKYSGDYKKASITKKPHFVDKYIRDNIDLTKINSFHLNYDPFDRTVKCWMVRKNKTVADVCLPYYIDDEKWGAPLLNENYSSGFSASVSALIKVAAGDYRLRTGGNSDGQIWDLNQSATNDNSNAYRGQVEFPDYDGGDPRQDKHWQRLEIIGIPTTVDDITLVWAIDGKTQDPITQKLIEEGVKVDDDDAIVDQFFVGGTTVARATFDLGVVGKKLSWKLFDNTAGDDFFLTSAMFDLKILGARP
ncbi:MAG: hypothetical protein ACE5D6_06070, partial [Candidatus Zixiibacteriota bacterium]